MENIKVAIWGFGAMGSGDCQSASRKKGRGYHGRDATSTRRAWARASLKCSALKETAAPMSLSMPISTLSYRKRAVTSASSRPIPLPPRSMTRSSASSKKGVNVVTTAEEMSYPKAGEPELTAKMDAVARENGVSILGTGVNPGLIMDVLALCLSGGMTDVEFVQCKRVNSLRPLRPRRYGRAGRRPARRRV